MKKIHVLLNTAEKVKEFVNTVSKFDADFDLISGRYIVDGKSIMGIFSMDLSKPLELVIHSEKNIDNILYSLSIFAV